MEQDKELTKTASTSPIATLKFSAIAPQTLIPESVVRSSAVTKSTVRQLKQKALADAP